MTKRYSSTCSSAELATLESVERTANRLRLDEDYPSGLTLIPVAVRRLTHPDTRQISRYIAR